MLKIGVTGVPGAGRECAGAIADLDQVAERVVGLVPAGLVAMITIVSRDRFDAHDEFPVTGQGECPGAAPVRVAQ